MILVIVGIFLTLVVHHEAWFPGFSCMPPEHDNLILICGSDGHSYMSLCEYNRAKMFNPHLLVYDFGPCKKIFIHPWDHIMWPTTEQLTNQPSPSTPKTLSTELPSQEETGNESGDDPNPTVREISVLPTETPTGSRDESHSSSDWDDNHQTFDTPNRNTITSYPDSSSIFRGNSTTPKDWEEPAGPNDDKTSLLLTKPKWLEWLIGKAKKLLEPDNNGKDSKTVAIDMIGVNKRNGQANDKRTAERFPIGTLPHSRSLRVPKKFLDFDHLIPSRPKTQDIFSKSRSKMDNLINSHHLYHNGLLLPLLKHQAADKRNDFGILHNY